MHTWTGSWYLPKCMDFFHRVSALEMTPRAFVQLLLTSHALISAVVTPKYIAIFLSYSTPSSSPFMLNPFVSMCGANSASFMRQGVRSVFRCSLDTPPMIATSTS